MPVISLCCAGLLRSRKQRQEQSLFDAKFSVESNGFIPNFYKEQEVA